MLESETDIMLKRRDIRVRDPFIVLENDVYYMYATTGEKTMSYYTSTDLDNWEMGGTAFEIAEDSWAYKDVWASEVHRYKGKFYLFVSLLGKNGLRGTQIAVADTPKGPFVPITNGPATPTDKSCIDGTLFVENDIPYILYSRDWPDNHCPGDEDYYIGQICIAQLSSDLVSIVGTPKVLFNSNEVPISRETPHRFNYQGNPIVRYGSDAPFVLKLSDGTLFLTWSPYLHNNYVVLSAVSESSSVLGPWKHTDKALFDENGGHAMFFRNKENELCMCIHAPEKSMLERAHIFVMGEKDGFLEIVKEIEI